MNRDDARNETTLREGEKTVSHQPAENAFLQFIGTIHTPFSQRSDCPRQGDMENGPDCTIEIDPVWADALTGISRNERLEILYWLDKARRNMVVQFPRHAEKPTGTFALRSPNRPNPIGTSIVRLIAVEGNRLTVRGLDCLDCTPLVDIKPARSSFMPNIRTNG